MGLFEPKEEKIASKVEELIETYGLSNLDEEDFTALRKIAMSSVYWLNTGETATQINVVSHLSVLIQQNWIIMRQLSKLNAHNKTQE